MEHRGEEKAQDEAQPRPSFADDDGLFHDIANYDLYGDDDDEEQRFGDFATFNVVGNEEASASGPPRNIGESYALIFENFRNSLSHYSLNAEVEPSRDLVREANPTDNLVGNDFEEDRFDDIAEQHVNSSYDVNARNTLLSSFADVDPPENCINAEVEDFLSLDSRRLSESAASGNTDGIRKQEEISSKVINEIGECSRQQTHLGSGEGTPRHLGVVSNAGTEASNARASPQMSEVAANEENPIAEREVAAAQSRNVGAEASYARASPHMSRSASNSIICDSLSQQVTKSNIDEIKRLKEKQAEKQAWIKMEEKKKAELSDKVTAKKILKEERDRQAMERKKSKQQKEAAAEKKDQEMKEKKEAEKKQKEELKVQQVQEKVLIQDSRDLVDNGNSNNSHFNAASRAFNERQEPQDKLPEVTNEQSSAIQQNNRLQQELERTQASWGGTEDGRALFVFKLILKWAFAAYLICLIIEVCYRFR